MRKIFLLLGAPLLTAWLAQAQSPFPVRHNAHRSASVASIQQKIAHNFRISSINGPVALAKGASTTPLSAQASYDYVNSGGLVDSMRVTYSGGRGSAFDFLNLMYDFSNSMDIPDVNSLFAQGYVQYDSLIDYDPSTTPMKSLAGIRQYNGSGKVTYSLQQQVSQGSGSFTLFTYNAQGRVSKVTYVDYDPVMMQVIDSNSRTFFTYSSAGYVVRDSSESWNGSSWDPQSVTTYVNNAAGHPTTINYGFSMNGFFLPFVAFNVTYNGSNQPSAYVIQLNQNGTGLENIVKDTFAYTGNMLYFGNEYSWDTTAQVWILNHEERRHLNGASLPDSVWTRTDNTGTGAGPWDTAYQKLVYNADNNPVNRKSYIQGTAQVQTEDRWYYEVPTGIKDPARATVHTATAYPNPTGNVLYLKSPDLAAGSSWTYRILNSGGLLIAEGTGAAGKGIPVSMLSAGIYFVSVTDAEGTVAQTTFLKR